MESDLAGTVLAGNRFAAIVVLSSLLEKQLGDCKGARHQTRRQIRQWHSFYRRRRPDWLDAGADELFRDRRDQGPLFRGEDTPGKPAAELRPGVSGVRRRTGGQSGLPQSKRRRNGLVSITPNLVQCPAPWSPRAAVRSICLPYIAIMAEAIDRYLGAPASHQAVRS
jgi:hypothetical protein